MRHAHGDAASGNFGDEICNLLITDFKLVATGAPGCDLGLRVALNICRTVLCTP